MVSALARLNANFRVSTRVFSGFALVLTLLLGLAFLAVTTLADMRARFTTYAAISQSAQAVADIDSDFIEIRRALLVYLADGRAESLDVVRRQAAGMTRKIEALLPRFVDPGRRRMLEETRDAAGQYMRNVETMATQKQAAAELQKTRIDGVGQRITQGLASLATLASGRDAHQLAGMIAQAQQSLLELRLDDTRVQSNPDAALMTHVAQTARMLDARLETTIGATTEDPEKAALRQAQEQARAYATAITELGAALISINATVTGPNRALATRVAEGSDQLVAAQNAATQAIADGIEGGIKDAERTAMVVSAAALGLGVLLAWLIGRGIAGPVTRMTGAMTALAAGHLDTEIPARANRDEIGAMAKAVQVFKDNAIAVKRMEEDARAAAIQAEAEKKAAMRKLADDFQAAVGGVVNGVSSAATEMQGSAQSLATTAEQTTRQASAVSVATEEASANVQTVAAATEELAASVTEISRQVVTSSTIANRAVEQARATDTKVQGLSDAASQIGDVVRLISDIAGRTNLLALNATIEAARAGEAGKGFAVVASEVKNLATQTAKATEEIGTKVAEMQAATSESVGAIRSIGETIAEMSGIAAGIASAVEEQGAATQEIARNVQEAARGTQAVSANIGGVTQASGETGAAATQMLGAAGELAQQAETLRREVDGFLASVRAA